MVKSFRLVINDRQYTVEIGDLAHSPLTVVVNGETYKVDVQGQLIGSAKPATSVVREAGPERKVVDPPLAPRPRVEAVAGAVTAPLPGKVLEIKVKEGDRVKTGDVLFVAESMKMEITIPAPGDGVIKAIRVAVGQTVRQGEVLADME
ncbi:MAG: biotin/lipoyl-containing protein [Dehalococcoidia bacterium]